MSSVAPGLRRASAYVGDAVEAVVSVYGHLLDEEGDDVSTCWDRAPIDQFGARRLSAECLTSRS
jgi:hypothetical protein